MKQKHLVLLAAVVVLALAGYFYINRNNEATAPEDTNENINVPATEGMENNIPVSENSNTAGNTATKTALVIGDQTPGSSVTIDNFFLETPGFIVIHEVANDRPGTVVGSSGWLNKGAGQDLEFKANLKPGTTYFGLIYTDNGDKKFSLSTDTEQPLRFTQGSQCRSTNCVAQFSVGQ